MTVRTSKTSSARSIFARRISGRRVAYSHPHITKVHAINARTGGIIPCSYTGRLFRASYADRTPSLCKVSIGAVTDPELQVSLAGSQLDRVGLRGGVGFDPALGFVNRRNVSHASATAGYLLLTRRRFVQSWLIDADVQHIDQHTFALDPGGRARCLLRDQPQPRTSIVTTSFARHSPT